MYDLIIIGGGPAGITASIYAARKGLKFLVITKDIGGQAVLSNDVENYTGFQFITGFELAQKFKEHLVKFNVELHEWEPVTFVERRDNKIVVATDKDIYESKTVIIASGRIPRLLNIKGEEEFKNKGVTYCATCDGPFFKNKDVAVIGGGNSALDAVLQLINIANRIYLINNNEELKADDIMVEKAVSSKKVEIFNNANIKEIVGSNIVEGITVDVKGDNKELNLSGVFVEIGSDPVSSLAKDVIKNKHNEINVNCKCETNIPGIYAAGDVTNVFAKQIVVACGEGAKATMAVFEYLSKT